VRLRGRLEVDAAHERGVLREDVDEAFLAELHQRIAHGGLAQAVAACEFGAGQHRGRREFERDDHLAQAFEHLRRGMARAVEGVGFFRSHEVIVGSIFPSDALMY